MGFSQAGKFARKDGGETRAAGQIKEKPAARQSHDKSRWWQDAGSRQENEKPADRWSHDIPGNSPAARRRGHSRAGEDGEGGQRGQEGEKEARKAREESTGEKRQGPRQPNARDKDRPTPPPTPKAKHPTTEAAQTAPPRRRRQPTRSRPGEAQRGRKSPRRGSQGARATRSHRLPTSSAQQELSIA